MCFSFNSVPTLVLCFDGGQCSQLLHVLFVSYYVLMSFREVRILDLGNRNYDVQFI